MSDVRVNSLIDNRYYPGDIGWVLVSTALVWLMIPGVGFFYGGMARSKNALSLYFLGILTVAVVSLQWFMFGYSLTFSTTGNAFIGNFDNALFLGLKFGPSPVSTRIPDLLYATYEGMFAAITPAIAIGAAAERARTLPTLVFIFIWSTLVYDPIASWTWSEHGWFRVTGGLDYAGGTPVHISSGAAALAWCLILGKRNGYGVQEFRANNMSNVILGTVFLWFGWFGFNGGSASSADIRAIIAFTNSNLAASTGGLVWMMMDYRYEKKLSVIGFCSGVVSGLVCITPGSGYVNVQYAPLFGLIGSVSCNLALKLKSLLSFDDALDVFAVHGVGGFVGNLLTGLFADKNVASLSGEEIQGGAINGYYRQFGIQLANSLAALSYSFVFTYLILFVINRIPHLYIRVDAKNEERGIDEVELGEQAHYFVERYSSALKDLTATKSALAKSKSNASLNKHFRQQNLHNQRIEEIPLPPTHNYI
nr:10197_t:CDS:2 [Entrophospora candida]